MQEDPVFRAPKSICNARPLRPFVNAQEVSGETAPVPPRGGQEGTMSDLTISMELPRQTDLQNP